MSYKGEKDQHHLWSKADGGKASICIIETRGGGEILIRKRVTHSTTSLKQFKTVNFPRERAHSTKL